MQRKNLSKPRTTSRSSHLQKQSVVKSAAKHPLIALHQSIGNRAVQRLIQSHYIQAKLQVSTPGDKYEQEADRVADKVMRMPDAQVNPRATVSNQTQISRLQRQCTECEEKVQRQELEEEEDLVQTKPDGHGPMIQRLCTECSDKVQRGPATPEEENEKEEEMVQGKAAEGGGNQVSQGVQSQIESFRGGGQPLPKSSRAYFESRFGHDFGGVRIHAGAQAAKVARSINAQAFTVGRDVAFAAGQYSPDTSRGQRLLAHELTHVVQQGGTAGSVQRQHVADTGFRYTPPASVTRSIVEIQGIVGSTPDGVYGENTRRAVEIYQTKLKSLGFYTDTLDGKWGKNTDAAHVRFATDLTPERIDYNCTGFAFKDYVFRGLKSTEAEYAKMTKLADCSKPCSPFFHKFFLWKYDLEQKNSKTGQSLGAHPDFHTVGGQTDKSGNGPAQVMSKNGPRPVEGPKPPLDWKPLTGPRMDINNNPMPDWTTHRTGHVEECFCNDKLPGRP